MKIIFSSNHRVILLNDMYCRRKYGETSDQYGQKWNSTKWTASLHGDKYAIKSEWWWRWWWWYDGNVRYEKNADWSIQNSSMFLTLNRIEINWINKKESRCAMCRLSYATLFQFQFSIRVKSMRMKITAICDRIHNGMYWISPDSSHSSSILNSFISCTKKNYSTCKHEHWCNPEK